MPKKRKYYIDPTNLEGFLLIANVDAQSRLVQNDLARRLAISAQADAYVKKAYDEIDALKKKREQEYLGETAAVTAREKVQTDEEASEQRGFFGNLIKGLAEESRPGAGPSSLVRDEDVKTASAAALMLGESKDPKKILRDNWNSFLSKLNEVQADSAFGELDSLLRNNELRQAATTYYTLLAETIPKLEAQRDSVLRQADSVSTRLAKVAFQNRAKLLLNQIDAANVQMQLLKPQVDKLEKEADKNVFSHLIDGLFIGERGGFGSDIGSYDYFDVSSGKIQTHQGIGEYWWGKVTPFHDRVNDVMYKLYGIGNKNLSAKDKLKMLKDADTEAKTVQDDMDSIIKENIADANKYENRISNYFKLKRDTPGMDLTDPDTYLYKFSGVMGSSASSWMKQGAGMLASLAAAATGNYAAMAAMAPIVFGLNQSSGRDENYAEVQQAANELLTQKLGGKGSDRYNKLVETGRKLLGKDLSDDNVINQYLAGNVDAKDKGIDRVRTDVAENIPSLFDRDMAATTWDSTVDTILQLMPIGALSKAGKFRWARAAKYKGLRQLAKVDEAIPAGRDIRKAFRAGFGTGAKLGGTTSVLTAPITGTALGLANTGRVLISKGLDKAGTLGRAINKRMEQATRLFDRLDPAMISPKANTTMKYIKDVGGKLALSSVSEGVEEGKQHLYADQFKKGQFTYGDNTLFNIATDDMLNGLKMGYLIAGIPLDGLGLMTLKDEDLMADIKGGMLGGFLHTGTVNVALNIRPYIQEMRATDAIVKNAIADNTANQDIYKKSLLYAKQGWNQPSRKRFDVAFDSIRKYNRDYKKAHGDYAIDPQTVDDEQDRMNSVFLLMNNDEVKTAAKNLGIIKDNIGTDFRQWVGSNNAEYQRFIAALATVINQRNDAADVYNDILGEESGLDDQFIQKQESAVNQTLNEIFGNESQLTARKRNPKTGQIEWVNRDDLNKLFNAQAKSKRDDLKALAQLAALLNIRLQITTAMTNQASLANKDKVLNNQRIWLKNVDDRIKQISEGTDAEKDGKVIHMPGLSEKFQALLGFTTGRNGRIVFGHDGNVIRTLDDINRFVSDPEMFDQYQDLYQKLFKAESAVNMHDDAINNILGKGKDKNFFRRLDKTLQDVSKSNDEFWDAFEKHDFNAEDQKDAFDAQNQQEENGWSDLNIHVRGERIPVFNDDGTLTKIPLDKNGDPTVKLDPGQWVDDDGNLYIDQSRDYKFDESLSYGEWDRTAEDAAKDEFHSLINGGYVHLSPKNVKDKKLSEILSDIRALNEHAEELTRQEKWAAIERKKAEYEAEQEANMYIDESDEGGNTVTEEDLEKDERIQAARKRDAAAFKAVTKGAKKADFITRKFDTRWNVWLEKARKNSKNKNGYFIIRRDKDGNYFRDYEIDPDKIFVPKAKYVKPSIQVDVDVNKLLSGDRDMFPDFRILKSGKVVHYMPKRTYEKPTITVKKKKTTPPIALLPPPVESKDPQLRTIDSLKIKQRVDLEMVQNDPNGYHTTSQSYFIKTLDGYIKRYLRLHAVLASDPRTVGYRRDILELATKSTLSQILGYTQDELIDWINQEIKDYPQLEYDLTPYKLYLNDNPNMDADEFNAVKNDLAWLVNPQDFGDSVRVGNFFDEIARLFFDEENGFKARNISKKEFIKWVSELLFEHEPQYTIGEFAEYGNNPLLIELFVDDLIATQNYFDKLHWKVSSFNYTWYSDFTNFSVAGLTDLIAVDKDGFIHIIDFKTTRSDWGASFTGVSGENPKYNYTQVHSKENTYSAQLTAYAMMIKDYFGSQNVLSTQILGISVLYNFSNIGVLVPLIYSASCAVNGKPNLIDLKWSKDAQDVLDGTSPDKTQEIESKKQNALELNDQVEHIIVDIRLKLDDINKYEDKYPETLLIVSFLKNAHSVNDLYGIDIITNPGFDPINNAVDLNVLNSYIADLQGIVDSYQQALDTIQSINNKHAEYLLRKSNNGGDGGSGNDGGPKWIPAGHKGDGRKANGFVNMFYKIIEQDQELRKATIAPDFINNAVVRVWSRQLKDGSIDLFCSIEYNGKTYSGPKTAEFPKGMGILLSTQDPVSRIKTKVGQSLIDKVVDLEKKYPGLPIYATSINRTSGRIYSKLDERTKLPVINKLKDTDLIGDIYDVDLSTDYGKIGFFNHGTVQVFVGGNDTQRDVIYTYTGDELTKYGTPAVPEQGLLVYLDEMQQDERLVNPKIPITIRKVKFADSDVDFIIDAISNHKLHQTYRLEDGRDTRATLESLINLLIPTARSITEILNVNTIYFNPQNSNVITIVNRDLVQENGSFLGAKTYDLSTENGRSNLKQDLKNMYILEQHSILISRLGASTTNWLPFQNIYKFFASKRNSDVKHISITDSILFDFDDFASHDSIDTGRHYEGLSGAGWYVLHGLWTTTYDHIDYANVSIGDVDVQNPNLIQPEQNGVNQPEPLDPQQQLNEQSVAPEDFDPNDNDYTLTKIDDHRKGVRKISQKRAEKRLNKILGKDAPVEFVDEIKTLSNEPISILGKCHADSIVLASNAYSGVEFHEAFHRVLELLMDWRKRNKIYKEIASTTGYDITNKNGVRQAAEYAADGFMDYMSGYMEVNIPIIKYLYNKIRDWIKFLTHYSQRDLYRAYAAAARGKFAGNKVLADNVRRFKSLFKTGLNYEVHGIDFKHCMNAYMYDLLKQSTMYFIVNGTDIDRSGRDIQLIGKHIDQKTLKAGIDKFYKNTGVDVLGESTPESERTFSQRAMREMYNNLQYDDIRTDIADEIAFISTNYKLVDEEESAENTNAGESLGNNIGEHTRLSYEFSLFSKTSSRVRFFFATIPNQQYAKRKIVDRNGNETTTLVPKYVLNELELPTFVPVSFVFNEFINLMHDCDTIFEIILRAHELGTLNPLFEHIARLLNKIYKKTYVWKDGKVQKNDDYEALLVQLTGTIRSNKHTFEIVKSTQNKNGQFGQFTLNVQSTDMSYNADMFTRQWGSMLADGGTPYINVSPTGLPQLNPRRKVAKEAFAEAAKRITMSPDVVKFDNGAVLINVGLIEWFNNVRVNTKKDENGNEQKEYVLTDDRMRFKTRVVDETNSTPEHTKYKLEYLSNPMDPGQLMLAKDAFIRILNTVGILFTLPELDYMLLNKYGTTDYSAMKQMFNSGAKEDSITSFLTFLNQLVVGDKLNLTFDGKFMIGSNKMSLGDVYTKMAFVKNLANWKYNYQHAHDQLTVLATHGKYYQISDNNYITDVVRNLNKRSDIFQTLVSGNDPYYYDGSETDTFGHKVEYGSLVAKELKNNPNAHLEVYDFVGFKTDKKGDTGLDYFEITGREDYVAKCQILAEGGIIFPTMSDKKTWKFLRGIKLPGLSYDNIYDNNGNIKTNSLLGTQILFDDNGRDMISMLDPVIDQFMSYAISEYKSILKVVEELKELLKPENKRYATANYYDKELGAKFSSLLGVIKDDGAYVSFNNNKKSVEENLHTAEQEFFSKDEKEQRLLIARNLMFVLDKELENAEGLKLITKSETDRGGSKYFNYDNKGLDAAAIEAIYNGLIANDALKDKYYTDDADLRTARYKSFATVLYLLDISNKAIMSGQEIERLFSGNPAFYKWKYDKNTGVLYDRTVDELKRLGGLVSTGVNNFLDLQDIPAKYFDSKGHFTGKYNCAEIDNEMVTSKLYDLFKDWMYEGQLRSTIYNRVVNKRVGEYVLRVNAMDQKEKPDPAEIDREIENIKLQVANSVNNAADSGKTATEGLENLAENVSKGLSGLIKKQAADMSDSYRIIEGDHDHEGIDVADGAAYVTDTMMEMLLRMNGSWSSDIAKAFELLRDDNINNITQKAAAYQKVITTVIGTLKYTAFGRRTNALTGALMQYYHKYALFPIFKSMATGRLMNIYQAMDKQGLDMLLINSGVKVGSEGSQPIEWNKYQQDDDEDNKDNYNIEYDNNGNEINRTPKPRFSESFKFNQYQAEFQYLRKQLNTDPDENKYRTVGTQMTKIIQSNWVPYNTYLTNEDNARTMTGKLILKDIMDSTNALSDLGMIDVAKEFFKTNSKGEFLDANDHVISINDRDKNNQTRLVLDQKKFSKTVRKMLREKDPNRNLLRALDIVEENGQYKLRAPLDSVQNSKWMESILISRINSHVIDVESPGAPFIQRSVWAMEGNTLPDTNKKGLILGDTNLPKSINGGKRLEVVNEEGSMDCVLSIDFFKKVLGEDAFMHVVRDNKNKIVYEIKKDEKTGEKIRKKKYDKDHKPVKDEKGNQIYETDAKGNPVYETQIKKTPMSFDEARNFLIARGIIGPNAKANIVAYRIPTQAQSSIHALRCVDVLPDVNDTVILPEEFTKITGSDFDIDKLFLNIVNYEVRQEKDQNGTHVVISDRYEEGTKEYYQNRLLRDYIAMLLDKARNDQSPRHMNILHRSIDIDTKLLTDVLADMEDGLIEEERPYQFYSLYKQTQSKNNYITGKVGIGPYALNNNNHILTMLYDVKFKHYTTSILSALTEQSNKLNDGHDAYNFESLGNYYDRDGNSIFSWLSGLINGHVDIAKDPWVSRMNINPFTYNISNLLVRIGLGKNTFYFLNQPIMRALAKAYTNASSKFMSEDNSKYIALKKALQKTADDYFKPEGGVQILTNGFTYDDIVKLCTGVVSKEDAQRKQDLNRIIARMLLSEDIRTMCKTSGGSKELQLLVYAAYLLFDKFAYSLSNLVKYCKIDTKKQGKSVAEQEAYRNGYKLLFGASKDEIDSGLVDGQTTLLENSSLQRLKNESYIGRKTSNALTMTTDILSKLFIEATPSFLATCKFIINSIGKADSVSGDLYSKVSLAVSAAIKSNFFNGLCSTTNKDTGERYDHGNSTFMHDLVSSSHDISKATYQKHGNYIKLHDKINHSLLSYVGKSIIFKYKTSDGKEYKITAQITGIGNDGVYTSNLVLHFPGTTLILSTMLSGDLYGDVELVGGANTIYDRLARLKTYIMSNDALRNLRTPDGSDINNILLRYLVQGNTFDWNQVNFPGGFKGMVGSKIGTYQDLKFVKLFNFLDEGGNNANYLIDAWDELLNYKNEDLGVLKFVRDFANDLVFYAFITSGDTAGFTKMFKYVPYSWRDSSGYVNFIANKLGQYDTATLIDDIDIDDIILNNWTDNTFVPTYQEKDAKTNLPNFIEIRGKGIPIRKGINVDNEFRNSLDDTVDRTGYPILLVGLHKPDKNQPYEATIDPLNGPEFIKVPRRGSRARTDSPSDYTVYRRLGVAESNKLVLYPVYVKVNPKGNAVKGGFMVTEYGRSDSYNGSDNIEYQVDPDALDAFWRSAASDGFIANINTIKANWGLEFASAMTGLRRAEILNYNNKNGKGKVVQGTSGGTEEGGNSGGSTEGSTTSEPDKLSDREVVTQLVNYMRDVLHIPVHGRADMIKLLKDHGYNNLQEFLGRKARDRYRALIEKHRPDLSNDEIEKALDFLHSLENNNYENSYIKAAIQWIVNGSITLPRDNVVAREIFDTAKKRHVDISKYKLLSQLILSDEMKPKNRNVGQFNPDEEPTFTNHKTVTTLSGRKFEVYDVENTYEGQRAVCHALAANYSASPWCLSTFTSNGEPTNSAKRFWEHYRNIPRKIAFENGKPVAFSSSDNYYTNDGKSANKKEAWWDLEDREEQYELSDNINNTTRYFEQHGNFIVPELEGANNGEFAEPEYPTNLEIIQNNELYTQRNINRALKGRHNVNNIKKYLPKGVDFALFIDRILELRPIMAPGEKYDERTVSIILGDTDYSYIYDTFVQLAHFVEENGLDALTEVLIAKTLSDNYNQILNFAPTTTDNVDVFNEINDPDDLPFFKTPNGEIYGFVTPDNQIYLDETVITPEHPIHEYTHIWDEVVYRNNRPLWNRGVLLMKHTSMWRTIENSKEYGVKWRDAGFSKDKLEYYIASEVHARLTGTAGSEAIDTVNDEKDANIISKLRQWIEDFWFYIKDTFSKWSKQDLQNLSVDTFVNMPLRDFMSGLNLYDVKPVDTDDNAGIKLTKGQLEARTLINNFVDDVISGKRDGDAEYFMLSGKAGTGKTTLINTIIEDILNKHPEYTFLVGAISHKATLVIASKVPEGTPHATLASMLGIRLNEDTMKFLKLLNSRSPIKRNLVIIIDEASMINEELFSYLRGELRPNNILIFLGDEGQLPPIRNMSNPFYSANRINPDDISHIISDNKNADTSYVLTERVRQGEGSPILEYGDLFWNYSTLNKRDVLPSGEDEFRHRKETKEGSIEFFNKTDMSKTVSLFKDVLATGNPNLIRIVAYRNNTVNWWNDYIRERIFGSDYSKDPKPGDILTAQDLFAKPIPFGTIDKNKLKYMIVNSKDYVVESVVKNYTDEHGILITVVTLKGKEGEWKILTPIQQNIDNFNNFVWDQWWPRVKALYNTNPMLYRKEKDIFLAYLNSYAKFKYGYAITSHKSQGSTYDVVVVDSPDISSVMKTTPISKARSIYTALTRARNSAIIIRQTPSELQGDVKELNDRINANKGVMRKLTPSERQLNNVQAYIDTNNQFDDSDFSDKYMNHCKL